MTNQEAILISRGLNPLHYIPAKEIYVIETSSMVFEITDKRQEEKYVVEFSLIDDGYHKLLKNTLTGNFKVFNDRKSADEYLEKTNTKDIDGITLETISISTAIHRGHKIDKL